jgi:hypothetical protein
VSTTDPEGRIRKAVYLPRECWDWLEVRSGKDNSSRNDLLEGIILLAMDEDAKP